MLTVSILPAHCRDLETLRGTQDCTEHEKLLSWSRASGSQRATWTERDRAGCGASCSSWPSGREPHLSPLLVLPGVDVEAAKRAEEELLLHDTRCWLNGGAMPEARHPRTGASALHVAAAKGYIEVMR